MASGKCSNINCGIENGQHDPGNAGYPGGVARVEKRGKYGNLCQWCAYEAFVRDRAKPKATSTILDMFMDANIHDED